MIIYSNMEAEKVNKVLGVLEALNVYGHENGDVHIEILRDKLGLWRIILDKNEAMELAEGIIAWLCDLQK